MERERRVDWGSYVSLGQAVRELGVEGFVSAVLAHDEDGGRERKPSSRFHPGARGEPRGVAPRGQHPLPRRTRSGADGDGAPGP